jgi:hypothetical protein
LASTEISSNPLSDPSRCPYNPFDPMLDYDPPFNEEFSADCDYWESIKLPWNEDDEDINIESLLQTNDVF